MRNERRSDAPLPSGQGGTPHGGATGAVLAAPAYGNYFVAAYPPFTQWTAEAAEPFRRRLSLPADGPEAPPLGLYVHVPFCAERCRYCYYLSYDGLGSGHLERYVDCLTAELRQYASSAAIEGRDLDFVYFGGGTPSLISESVLARLFGGLQEALPWHATREVTFECAPRSVTRSKLERLREAGVTRLSLGVQQLDDAVLARSGRVHSVRDVLTACEEIQRAGFEVFNLDLMVGMVGETRTSLLEGLEGALELEPDSFTIYQMEIPRNTPLYRDLASGAQPADELADWEEKHDRLALAFERLAAAGYEPISAYAMVRDRTRHDFLYQREQYRGADLLAIGASAFGYLGGMHYQNEARMDRYVERLEADELPVSRAHRLSDDERLRREFVLQLKLGAVERSYFRRKFGEDVVERYRSALEPLADAGWLAWDDARLALTPEGMVRVDHLIPTLYPAEYRSVPYA
ncbi:MAG: coproporphyrinogen-III oxidase family protein [Thermoanaerobaculia bacterium]|nr:coproporphyrinogen-III oxidase family protein [Thermoanaerobaculia bacterium]